MAITVTSKVTALERYKAYLKIISLFTKDPITGEPSGITDLEMQILDEVYHANNGKLNTEVRKHVAETLGMSSAHLTNYIGTMRKKKLFIENEINPKLMIDIPPDSNMTIHVNLKVLA